MKNVLIAVVLLAALVVGIGFVLPQERGVVRTVTIDAFPRDVFPHLEDKAVWKEWSPWDAQRDFASVEGNQEQGFKYELVIDEARMRKGNVRLMGQGSEQTRVRWALSTELGTNPLHRWQGLLEQGDVEDEVQAALDGLKRRVEKITLRPGAAQPAADAEEEAAEQSK